MFLEIKNVKHVALKIFSPNQELNEIILQRYKEVNCSKYGGKIELKDVQFHFKSGCKID
jgi:ABC-type polysaccharide/polyol phosphate transport system ATPase subunit